MFQNLPQVTKNILLLNIAFFVASLLLKSQGIDLEMTLGAHYVNSPFFEPYQIVTHFFMHSTDNFLHIFFNMWLFVMLGAYLENIWGAKRFFIFYLISAMGSFALYNMIGFIEIMNLKAALESPTFTGTPVLPTATTAVTQTLGDNSTKLATTAFVRIFSAL
jgi:membrane associated rhomboid family serine protease